MGRSLVLVQLGRLEGVVEAARIERPHPKDALQSCNQKVHPRLGKLRDKQPRGNISIRLLARMERCCAGGRMCLDRQVLTSR